MDASNDTTKRCTRCGNEYPLVPKWFYRNKNTPDGYRSECKDCTSAMLGIKTRRVVYDVPEGYKRCGAGDKCLTPGGPMLPATDEMFFRNTRAQDGLQSHCKTCRAEINRRWLQRNPGYSTSYFRRNRDVANERKRRYRKEHPERERIKARRRHNREKSVAADFTATDWHFALEWFKGCCAYCGHTASLFDYFLGMHQEHHIPVARGGGYIPGNIIPACQTCNLSKLDKEPHIWIVERFGKVDASKIERRIGEFFDAARKVDLSNEPHRHVTSAEQSRRRSLARRAEIAANPPIEKRCKREDSCVNPQGSLLPLTNEHFSYDKNEIDGFNRYCKLCERARQIQRARARGVRAKRGS